MRKLLPAVERFMAKVEPEPNSGCWLWTGALRGGYGEFRFGETMGAHRFSYMTFVEVIPSGLWVCHKCDQKTCVNPDHLFLGTNRDNQIDAVTKGRHNHATKATCLRGHDLSLARIYLRRNGRPSRQCRECYRLAQVERRRRMDWRNKVLQ